MENLISVIVPVFNSEKYLNRCVESIVNQSYKNLEIILVDDGSKDKSPQICDEWAKKDSRIKVIHKENGGVSSARNAGLDIAAGDYIAFADNDDFLDSDIYEFLLSNLLKYGAQISRCSFSFYYEEDKTSKDAEINKTVKIINSKSDILKDLYNSGFKCGVLWNKLYKKEIVDSIRFRYDLRSGGEDILFNYYVMKNCDKMVCYDISKYHYVIHNKNGIGGINFNYYMYSALKEIIADNDCPEIMYHKFYLFAYMTIHDILVRNQDADFNTVKNDILTNKKNILNTSEISMKDRIRIFLLQYFPLIYKFLVKH